ncbi:MAG: Rpn family recombination-promoting nuclease/putative transposase [Candidatus Cryptobacteroides sp.]
MEKTDFNSQKYVNLLWDSGFKIVYGDRENKELLIDLLNVILPEEAQVEDIIEYRDRELMKDTVFSKGTRLDLLCRGKNKTDYIVEVQRERRDPFFKRVLFYSSIVYRNNLPEGQNYQELTPVYVVGILDFNLEHENEDLWDADHIISHYEMTERRSGELAPTVFSCNFAELKRFDKSAEDCQTYRDQLFFWFRHSGQLDRIPEFINPSPKLDRLVRACDKAAFTPEKKLEYERIMLNELDQKNLIYQAEERGELKGREIGRAEGKAEGRTEEKTMIARNMLLKGYGLSVVSELTGLSEDELKNIQP